MDPDQMRELYQQNFYFIVAAGVAIGLLLGAIPLALSIRRKKTKLAFLGLVLSAIAGGFSPLMALVVAAVFTFLVLRGSKPTADESAPTPSTE
ncbi:MAG TPA: hypothetical protein VNA17_12455 [Pyrinomonadaceae bacterium]|nr:hypothetical protein [Pyrinomonadaceae bacterium]